MDEEEKVVKSVIPSTVNESESCANFTSISSTMATTTAERSEMTAVTTAASSDEVQLIPDEVDDINCDDDVVYVGSFLKESATGQVQPQPRPPATEQEEHKNVPPFLPRPDVITIDSDDEKDGGGVAESCGSAYSNVSNGPSSSPRMPVRLAKAPPLVVGMRHKRTSAPMTPTAPTSTLTPPQLMEENQCQTTTTTRPIGPQPQPQSQSPAVILCPNDSVRRTVQDRPDASAYCDDDCLKQYVQKALPCALKPPKTPNGTPTVTLLDRVCRAVHNFDVHLKTIQAPSAEAVVAYLEGASTEGVSNRRFSLLRQNPPTPPGFRGRCLNCTADVDQLKKWRAERAKRRAKRAEEKEEGSMSNFTSSSSDNEENEPPLTRTPAQRPSISTPGPSEASTSVALAPVKRGRGRPRKYPLLPNAVTHQEVKTPAKASRSSFGSVKTGRSRGRGSRGSCSRTRNNKGRYVRVDTSSSEEEADSKEDSEDDSEEEVRRRTSSAKKKKLRVIYSDESDKEEGDSDSHRLEKKSPKKEKMTSTNFTPKTSSSSEKGGASKMTYISSFEKHLSPTTSVAIPAPSTRQYSVERYNCHYSSTSKQFFRRTKATTLQHPISAPPAKSTWQKELQAAEKSIDGGGGGGGGSQHNLKRKSVEKEEEEEEEKGEGENEEDQDQDQNQDQDQGQGHDHHEDHKEDRDDTNNEKDRKLAETRKKKREELYDMLLKRFEAFPKEERDRLKRLQEQLHQARQQQQLQVSGTGVVRPYDLLLYLNQIAIDIERETWAEKEGFSEKKHQLYLWHMHIINQNVRDDSNADFVGRILSGELTAVQVAKMANSREMRSDAAKAKDEEANRRTVAQFEKAGREFGQAYARQGLLLKKTHKGDIVLGGGEGRSDDVLVGRDDEMLLGASTLTLTSNSAPTSISTPTPAPSKGEKATKQRETEKPLSAAPFLHLRQLKHHQQRQDHRYHAYQKQPQQRQQSQQLQRKLSASEDFGHNTPRSPRVNYSSSDDGRGDFARIGPAQQQRNVPNQPPPSRSSSTVIIPLKWTIVPKETPPVDPRLQLSNPHPSVLFTAIPYSFMVDDQGRVRYPEEGREKPALPTTLMTSSAMPAVPVAKITLVPAAPPASLPSQPLQPPPPPPPPPKSKEDDKKDVVKKQQAALSEFPGDYDNELSTSAMAAVPMGTTSTPVKAGAPPPPPPPPPKSGEDDEKNVVKKAEAQLPPSLTSDRDNKPKGIFAGLRGFLRQQSSSARGGGGETTSVSQTSPQPVPPPFTSPASSSSTCF